MEKHQKDLKELQEQLDQGLISQEEFWLKVNELAHDWLAIHCPLPDDGE